MSETYTRDEKWPDDFNLIVNYQWWCFRCQAYHFTPDCPNDYQKYGIGDYGTDGNNFDDCRTHEICPHCGQEIRK